MTATSTSALTGTIASRVIHVSPSGRDTNTGSADAPLRSLLAATRQIPDVIRGGHEWIIQLHEGEWDEPLVLDHFIVLGRLSVRGNTKNRDRYKVRCFRAYSVQGRAEIAGFTATLKDGSGPSFEWQRCGPEMRAVGLHAEGWKAKDYGVERVIGYLADYGTTLHVEDSTVNYKRYGIRANNLSRVFSKNNGGVGNMFDIGARWGGIVQAYGSQPEGVHDRTTDSGGIVIQGQGFANFRLV